MATDIKAAVKQQFDPVAAHYSVSSVHARGVDLAELVKAAQLRGDEQVLDAGCGTGHTALAFAPAVTQVVAVDFTSAMLEQGRRLAGERGLSNIDFRLADVERLPLADAQFDRVVTRYSAHHWPHPQQALREFKRVLRTDGLLLISDIVSYDDFAFDTFLQALELLRDPSHVRDHTAQQWLALCHDAGFVAEVAYRWDVRLDFADWIARMQTPPAHVTAIRSLLDGAPADIRRQLKVEADYSFSLQGALIRARPCHAA
jgi:ubiquinone/menaquinone biosynthesis C-methylase UbiE